MADTQGRGEVGVQLGGLPSDLPQPGDVPSALTQAAAALGHRPALTVLLPSGRQEQSVASLAQWAAKGAHLLELDLLLAPGDRLHLDAPPSWPAAAVVLAAWWAGVEVTLDGDAEVAVVQAGRPTPPGAEVLRLGDGIDGGPVEAELGGPEPWVRAVQAFPDQPPPPRGAPDAPAVVGGGGRWTQQQLLAGLEAPGAGPLGLTVDDHGRPSAATLVDLALRPLVVGDPTVVVRGVPPELAAGDRVAVWR